MIKPEEIQKRLQSVRKIAPWVEMRIERLRGLDGTTRQVGMQLMGRDESGKPTRGEGAGHDVQFWRPAPAEQFDKLSAEELLRLGWAMFPQFEDAFRAAWDLHARLPVQAGYARKPFRAPQSADLLLKPRRAFLLSCLRSLSGYEQDLPWIAAHASHLARYMGAGDIGLLLAGAIELGGVRASEIEQILRDTAAGTHEVGEFGRHVTTAFLCSSRPEYWEFIEKMLLAAQRQEGLRQVILESIDFSHPNVFRRMLRVINENNLVRFSATVRAANVWLGLQLDSSSAKYIDQTLQTIALFLDDETKRNAALAGDDAEQAFFALWSIAFDNGPASIAPASAVLAHAKPEMRFIALHFMNMLFMPGVTPPIVKAVEDADVRVACYAAHIAAQWLRNAMNNQRQRVIVQRGVQKFQVPIPPQKAGTLFELMERLHARIPEKPKPLKPLAWPWLKLKPDRQSIADDMIVAIGTRPRSKLLPYLKDMSPDGRQWCAQLLGLEPKLDENSRKALLELVGDASHGVRESAVEAMRRAKISADELPAIEPLLARKASDLRRGVLGLILSLDDASALASGQRLIESKNIQQRLAGLDLLTQLKDTGRSDEGAAEIARSFQSSAKSLTREEQVYLDKLLGEKQPEVTLENALGLMDPSKRTPPAIPQKRDVKLCTPAAVELLKSLDELVHQHREHVITLKSYGGDVRQEPLGAIRYGLPSVFVSQRGENKNNLSWRQPLEELPLHEVWFSYRDKQPLAQRDNDGLEVVRAWFLSMFAGRLQHAYGWPKDILQELVGDAPKLRYGKIVSSILEWLIAYELPGGLPDFCLDVLETTMASIPTAKLTETEQYGGYQFSAFLRHCDEWKAIARMVKKEGRWKVANAHREFALARWIDEPGQEVARQREWESDVFEYFNNKVANEHDFMDALLGSRTRTQYAPAGFNALAKGSTMLHRGKLSPAMASLVQRAIDRVLEIELLRGENETAATQPALQLKYAGGSDVLIRVLQAIGKDPKLQRNYSWRDNGQGKSLVFSHLIRVTLPAKDESLDAFAAAVRAAGIDEDALLAVAFYAPQWVRFIERAVGWEMLEEAVWWIHAHTKDQSWRVEHDIREGWNAEIRKLTPLTLEDLMEGAVDVDWFARVYRALGRKRWERLDEFAKYASGGGGHKRAQLFADAMLGRVKRSTLSQEILQKRKQDAVRALGLVPLDKKDPKKDLLNRYKTIQEFVRTSRQFGSMRQASEKLAARIGQENLARTAGYADPIRLQWAMEGLATADLAKGPVVVKVKDLSVSLAIDSDGLPEIAIARSGKALKSLPAEVKKDDKIAALMERKTDLRRSGSRMRQSLELAMCRGDRFGREELIELMGNAILRPMLERLVFIGDGIAGYPVGDGKALRDHAGKIEPIKKAEALRLAHSSDFLKLGQWTKWQRECFATERVQPFKQIFRELYVLTQQEKSDATFSGRYAGQQVNPRQAMALLGARGWVAAPEAGMFRTFHDEKIVAWIEFLEGFFTPADVEGLTLEKIRFAKRGENEYAPLKDLPPRLFSEVMRDVDLIVSVAHRGAVEPEASASTIELRAALLREMLNLLKLGNVKLKEPHVHIAGTRSEYSVHLGSGMTHILPGGALFIVPVHSQHRGRIFLPFADDDPRTAEVISKVMLLARDQELRDPNLLDQIRTLSASA